MKNVPFKCLFAFDTLEEFFSESSIFIYPNPNVIYYLNTDTMIGEFVETEIY